jgi:hypothetical protein
MGDKKSDIVKIGKDKFRKEAFIMEEQHPVIGRILIVDGVKFKVLDPEPISQGHRSGTFITRLTKDDELKMQEYEDALDELSEKLAGKVDVKRMIKENIREQPLQDLKTGLYILKEEGKGAKVENNHRQGCYQLDLHCANQSFTFITGRDAFPGIFDVTNQR